MVDTRPWWDLSRQAKSNRHGHAQQCCSCLTDKPPKKRHKVPNEITDRRAWHENRERFEKKEMVTEAGVFSYQVAVKSDVVALSFPATAGTYLCQRISEMHFQIFQYLGAYGTSYPTGPPINQHCCEASSSKSLLFSFEVLFLSVWSAASLLRP